MNAGSNSTIPIILRRKSVVTTTSSPPPPSSSSSSSTFSSSVDFELVSIKPPCYTSLRDILPSPATVVKSPNSPYSAGNLGGEILIRDRLVKQAAWAYLRPMSTSPEPDGTTVFRRLWTQFSGSLLRLITTAFDCLLPSINPL